jgi:hypothetical protein
MGQAQVTPKTLFLSHFLEIRAKGHNYGMEIKKGKFVHQNGQPSM